MVELDDSIKQELMDAFTDLYDATEAALSVIVDSPKEELLRDLFRSIHTIKGNAGICGLTSIVNFTHAIEEVAESLRSHRYTMSEPIRDCIQLGMDRLHDIHESELLDKQYDTTREKEYIDLFHRVSVASAVDADYAANALIDTMSSGVNPQKTHEYGSSPNITAEEVSQKLCLTIDNNKRQNDLLFFQELSLLIDSKYLQWHSKSFQLYEWAHKINQIAGSPVNSEQFSAAIYMHDIGLAYIPDEILFANDYADNELTRMHPMLGFNHLDRIPGWEEAAIIVAQHHEQVNGEGYPKGLKSQDIHPGAKILAIVDAFFHQTNGSVNKDQRKTVVRAVSQINAGIDTIFDGMWVQCFNHMLRKELKDGMI